MKQEHALHDLFNVNEHLSCRNYMTDLGAGFAYESFQAGERFDPGKTFCNYYILFFLGGEFRVRYNEFENCFHAGEMVMVRSKPCFVGEAVTAGEVVALGFDYPQSACDKLVFESYNTAPGEFRYRFEATPIRTAISLFLDLLVYALRNGINCVHFHDMKHKEFFLLLRGFYSSQEIRQFVFPVLGRDLDFRSLVLKNYARLGDEHNLCELIEASHLSRSRFYEQFRLEFDMSPKQWLDKQKVQQLRLLATDPQKSVKDIMYELNFNSRTAFHRFCKAHFNLCPSKILEER